MNIATKYAVVLKLRRDTYVYSPPAGFDLTCFDVKAMKMTSSISHC